MYELIAQEYSSIFPLDPGRLQMTAALAPEGSTVLDIGCASGDFPAALAAAGYRAEGWEPDPALFETAITKYAACTDPRASLQFDRKGMLDLRAERAYALVTCLGNTLPHLKDAGEISDFLERAHHALVPGGQLVLQLLNYRVILEQGGKEFQNIETESVVFRRSYRTVSEKRIDFEIETVHRADNTVYRSSSVLYPVTDSELRSLIEQSGFSSLRFAKNYPLETASGNEAFYIVTAQKTE